MNAADKKAFIQSLCDSVRDDLQAKVDDMPDDWDGIELRQLIASKFSQETRPDQLRGRRGREYRNELYTRNL